MMTRSEIADVVAQTDGYSGADVTNLCKDAALGPIRSLQVRFVTVLSPKFGLAEVNLYRKP